MQNKKFAIINAIYFTALAVLSVIFLLGYLNVIHNDIILTLLIQVLVMTAIPLFFYTLFISKNKKTTLSDFGFKKVDFRTILLAFVLGIVLFALNVFISSIFSTLLGTFGFDNNLSITPEITKAFILTAILPGVCEEILHRGLVLGGIKKTGNKKMALILSSIFFGLMHLDISKFFYTAILGCLMGLVVLAADSIWPSIIIHFMNNFLAIYFTYGPTRNWPLANLKTKFVGLVSAGGYISGFLIVFSLIVLLLLIYYGSLYLLHKWKLERDVEKLAVELNLDNMPTMEVKEKIEMIDGIMQTAMTKKSSLIAPKEKFKYSFTDKIFMFSTFFMASLLTIITFIWGIL